MDNMMRPRPRPRPPVRQPVPPVEKVTVEPVAAPPEIADDPKPLLLRRRRRLVWALGGVMAGILLVAGLYVTYRLLLLPVDGGDTSAQKIVIESGQSFGEITQTLADRSLIRSPLAFEVMARLAGRHNDVKAGTCVLHRTESAEQILDKITSGCHDFKSITFYPGATLYRSLSKPNHMDVTDVLLTAGYTQTEIDAALTKTYTTDGIDLFAGKPASADLEGYVYGETYYVDVDASVEDILQTTFDQMATDIVEGGYVAKFKAQGLNLYQAITLASIVQRELSCSASTDDTCYSDQTRIAGVFYNRLSSGMSLGSDVTFYYAADKLGVTPAVDIDSPYNTRIHTGLPPGPISAPGVHALEAVANPASTEYLYFIAGDDGKVYFARTEEEHQQNIAKYCQKLCSEL